MLEHVLKLGLRPGAVDHDYGRFSPGNFAHLSLVVVQNFLDDLGHGLSVGPLFHDDLGDVLDLLFDDGLVLQHLLEDVLDHLSCDVLLGQHESLDQLLLGLEDRLLSHDFLDLPFGDLPRAVLVLLVHVTVLVAMLHSLVLLFASGGASSSPAACPLSDFTPVTIGLVSAAATAAARFARPAALAGDGFIFWVFGVFGAFRLLVVFIVRRFILFFV